VFPRDIVCLTNISINTLHKGDDDDDVDNNNNNNIVGHKPVRIEECEDKKLFLLG